MLKLIPQKFFSCDCDSGTSPSGHAHTLCPPTATICDDRYLTMASVPSGKLLVIAPGTNCQAYMANSDAGALIVSAGGNLGYIPTKTPALSLPKLAGSPATGAPDPFPFIMISTGSGDTTPWKQLPCPTAGEWYIKATTGGWVLVQNSPQATQLGATFAAAANGTSLEAMGFVDVGSGVYQPRRLIGSGTLDVPMLLHWNGTSGRYEMKAAAITDSLYIGNIKATTFGEVSALGVPTADSFAIRPNSGITQANVRGLMINGPLGTVYRAPAHTFLTAESGTHTATQTATGGFDVVPSHTMSVSGDFNFPTVEVNFMFKFNGAEDADFGLFQDGSLVHTWSTSHGAAVESHYSGSWILTGVTLGTRTFDIRVKSTAANTYSAWFSNVTVKTLPS